MELIYIKQIIVKLIVDVVFALGMQAESLL